MAEKSIIDLYMKTVLEEGKTPDNVFKFCKINKISESDFYNQYGSLKVIEKKVYGVFLEKTLDLLNNNQEYAGYSSREKILSFYYTFFEMLKANRSYVLFSLNENKNALSNLEKLSELKKAFKAFIKDVLASQMETKIENLQKLKAESFQEAAWLQLLATLKFWIDDESAGFEKTDILIEKAVNAAFDILDNPPMKSIVDLGKFLFKEKLA